MAHAGAAPISVELVWHGAGPCSSQSEVLAEIARMLAETRAVHVPVSARVDIDGPDGGLWRARLDLHARGGHSERQIEAVNCADITSAVVLMIAVAVEGGPLPAPRDAAPTPRVATASPAPDALRLRRDAAAMAPAQMIVTGAAVIDDGIMPHLLAPGIELGLGWTRAMRGMRLRALIGVGYFPTQRVIEPDTGRGGEFRLISASARFCVSLMRGRFDLGPCLGAEIESMTASGVGPAATFESTASDDVWAGATGGLVSSWTFYRDVALFVRAEGMVPLSRRTFVLQPGTIIVHQTSTIVGRATVGVELRF